MNRFRAWNHFRQLHPGACAGAEAIVAGLAIAAMAGAMPRGVMLSAWFILFWGMLSFQRPVAYQAVSAFLLGLINDVVFAAPLGGSCGALAGAMLLANVMCRGGRRWHTEHVYFLYCALVGGWIAAGLLTLVSKNFAMLIPSPAQAMVSLLVPLMVLALILSKRFVRRPRAHRCQTINLARYER